MGALLTTDNNLRAAYAQDNNVVFQLLGDNHHGRLIRLLSLVPASCCVRLKDPGVLNHWLPCVGDTLLHCVAQDERWAHIGLAVLDINPDARLLLNTRGYTPLEVVIRTFVSEITDKRHKKRLALAHALLDHNLGLDDQANIVTYARAFESSIGMGDYHAAELNRLCRRIFALAQVTSFPDTDGKGALHPLFRKALFALATYHDDETLAPVNPDVVMERALTEAPHGSVRPAYCWPGYKNIGSNHEVNAVLNSEPIPTFVRYMISNSPAVRSMLKHCGADQCALDWIHPRTGESVLHYATTWCDEALCIDLLEVTLTDACDPSPLWSTADNAHRKPWHTARDRKMLILLELLGPDAPQVADE
jgi:hypothetical protein